MFLNSCLTTTKCYYINIINKSFEKCTFSHSSISINFNFKIQFCIIFVLIINVKQIPLKVSPLSYHIVSSSQHYHQFHL